MAVLNNHVLTLTITVNKQDGKVRMDPSEDVAFPTLVQILAAVLTTTSEQQIHAFAQTQPHAFVEYPGANGKCAMCGGSSLAPIHAAMGPRLVPTREGLK